MAMMVLTTAAAGIGSCLFYEALVDLQTIH
jgi:hypothetical protein